MNDIRNRIVRAALAALTAAGFFTAPGAIVPTTAYARHGELEILPTYNDTVVSFMMAERP